MDDSVFSSQNEVDWWSISLMGSAFWQAMDERSASMCQERSRDRADGSKDNITMPVPVAESREDQHRLDSMDLNKPLPERPAAARPYHRRRRFSISDILTVALLRDGSPDDNPTTTSTTIHNNKEEAHQKARRDGHHNDTASEMNVFPASPSITSTIKPPLMTNTTSDIRGRFFNDLGRRVRSRSASLRTAIIISPAPPPPPFPSSPAEERVKKREKEKEDKPSLLSRFPFFRMASIKNKNKMTAKDKDREGMKKDTEVETQSIGTIAKPLPNFRGGPQWLSISRDAQIFSIDVFSGRVPRPPLSLPDSGYKQTTEGATSASPTTILPPIELKPLTDFRHLRYLKITGMMRTYQKYIWETVWRNPDLTNLWLEMALKPEITCRLGMDRGRGRRCRPAEDWPVIGPEWKMGEAGGGGGIVDGAEMYRGSKGDGTLHLRFGRGEYLDMLSIEKAKLRTMLLDPGASTRLPVRNLTLMNFVVDAGPLYLWFDAAKLRLVQFLHGCVDAGFDLPKEMRETVRVVAPEVNKLRPAVAACCCCAGVGKLGSQDDNELDYQSLAAVATG